MSKELFSSTPKVLSFLRRYYRYWHLLRISSAFKHTVKNCAQVLHSSTISGFVLWIVLTAATDSSLCLLEKVTTISLVFSMFNSRAINHTTPQTHTALSCGDVRGPRAGTVELCHLHTLPDDSLDGWTCSHRCKG